MHWAPRREHARWHQRGLLLRSGTRAKVAPTSTRGGPDGIRRHPSPRTRSAGQRIAGYLSDSKQPPPRPRPCCPRSRRTFSTQLPAPPPRYTTRLQLSEMSSSYRLPLVLPQPPALPILVRGTEMAAQVGEITMAPAQAAQSKMRVAASMPVLL